MDFGEIIPASRDRRIGIGAVTSDEARAALAAFNASFSSAADQLSPATVRDNRSSQLRPAD